jgi:hypothetical protein
MKKFAVLVLLACELAVGGCGSTTTSASNARAVTSGLWQSVMAGGSGVASGPELSFIMNFTVNGDGSLSVSQFSFNNIVAPPDVACFDSETETGTSTLTTDSGGVVEGPISFVVTSTSPAGNTLTLTGNETSASNITGTWQLVGGAGCIGGGTFIMTKS